MRKTLGSVAAASAAAIAVAVLNPGVANAETLTGWTGASTANGIAYLHNSSVTNAPMLFATSNVWTAFGQTFGANAVGINARLFKSGVLCDATDYWYNGLPSVTYSVSTGNPDCGPGSYNSHGLVKLFNGTGYNSMVTFPSSPLNFGVGLRSAPNDNTVERSTNRGGQSVGSGANIESDSELPDLVAAFGTNGEQGYVKKNDLASPDLSQAAVAALPLQTQADGTKVRAPQSRSIPLYDVEGQSVIGQFTVR